MVVDVPLPAPQPGEVLVRTAASLVSAGTERMVVEFAEKSLVGKARSRPDLVVQVLDKARREGVVTTIEAAFNRLDQPMPLGYSSAGTVIALGAGVQRVKVGERVACAGGGYAVHAEYACVPVNLIAPLPDAVDFEAAAFATLGAIALHGFRLAETQLGEQVAVIGLGLLGLLAGQIARAAGCRVIGADLLPERIELARRLGIEAVDTTAAVDAAAAFTRGRGCDAVLICADTPSNDPVELAGAVARDRAHIVAVGAVGLTLPRKVYYEKELSFINSRSYGPGRYDPAYEEAGRDYPVGYVRWTEGRNLEAVVDLIADERLDVRALISHHFPLEQAPDAYALITGKRSEPFLGVLLTYSEGEQPEMPSSPHPVEAAAVLRAGADLGERRDPFTGLDGISTRKAGSDPVGFGVLGAGNFAAAVLLPAMKNLSSVRLVGVATASGMSARNAADRFGFAYAAADRERILDDPDVEAVAILTPHQLHAAQAIEALQAGKHVFCEKPLALNEEDLAAVEAALQACPEQILMVGYNRRFAPLAQRMKSFFAGRSEPLAAHYRVNAGYLPLTHWTQDLEKGGGRILGEACHFIDFLIFLTGTLPVEISARGLPDGGRYREDNVLLQMVFPDGSLGQITYLANGDKTFPKERVEVFCGGGLAVLDDFRSLECVRSGKRETTRSRLRQDKGHRAEMEIFAAAIRSGGPPPIPAEQIFGGMRATFAGLRALRSGRSENLKSSV